MSTNRFVALTIVALVGTASARALAADIFGSGANAFDIEFVTISNPRNPSDTTGEPNPAGSVPYSFRIGKFEISEQMIDKANLLGDLGITKDTEGIDKPATSISWNEAARFVNWLNTSTGTAPAYKFALRPGDAGYNSNANIEPWLAGDAGYNPDNVYRNSLARYFLPSADEWYKAAFYDPTSGVYYDYPTGSDTIPTPVDSGTEAGTAVYAQTFGGPADITLAGGLSPYGTMAQGGNVYEWEETDFDLINDSGSSERGLRSGSWANIVSGMHAFDRSFDEPTFEFNLTGFRVASTPEPGTLVLATGGLALLSCICRIPRHFPN